MIEFKYIFEFWSKFATIHKFWHLKQIQRCIVITGYIFFSTHKCENKNYFFPILWQWTATDETMVFILGGNSEHVAHA